MDQEIVVYIYMEYYSAVRKNDMGFQGKWMQSGDIMLSEVSQVQKDKATCFLSYVKDRSTDKHFTQK
jgi:hypothetical protein